MMLDLIEVVIAGILFGLIAGCIHCIWKKILEYCRGKGN